MHSIRVNIKYICSIGSIVLPEDALAHAGLSDETELELIIQNGVIILRRKARAGWAEAAKQLAAQHGDKLVMGEFGNAGDTELPWADIGQISASHTLNG